MPGSYAGNLKEGSRSEILADYLFSQWGAVTPVRGRDDIGVDLYCTLSDRIGPLAVVRDYFVVQVKSGTDPWVFKDQDSVKWLVEYPTPLFLACVDKKKGSVSVYHVMPRFYVWALGRLPKRLVLRPEERDDGEFVAWENGETFSLSAPIIRATIADLTCVEATGALGKVFQCWVGFDRENCDLMRQGLLRFRMPPSYRVNQPPNAGIGEVGYAVREPEFLERGILRLAESAECIGGQLFRQGDRSGALRALLLVYHLWRTYDQVLGKQGRWVGSIPGDLGTRVCQSLNEALSDRGGPRYVFQGIDEVVKALENDPVVKRFLTNL
jgi:hypothetical protein